ncbi:MAG TPA: serine hydrolase [Ramlibacter sp.]|nr:serine hydrolase [Ramlibacter sp.]
MYKPTLLCAAAILAMHAPAAAAQDSALAQRIDAAIAPYYQAGEPGAAVIVTKGGKVVFRRAYGLANIEQRTPLDPGMVLRIGSVTKQFTAAAILMLQEEGKLDLADDIGKHLPDFPTQGQKITIEHLLTHTSGIYSYTRKHDFKDKQHADASVGEVIAAFKDEPLDFQPGTRWAYSNSGYYLLGAIIEKVSGKPYAEFIHQRILAPLKMTHTAYEGVGGRTPQAIGYSPAQGKLAPSAALSPSKTYAAGALVSTVDDLARWDAAIASGKLLKPATWQRVFTPYALASGASTNYGYGWETGKLQGTPMVAHGGNTNGFSTYTMRVPAEQLYVAVLSNAEYGLVQPDVVASKAAAIAMGKPLPEYRAIAMEPKALEAFTGTYQAAGAREPRMVAVADGKLALQRPGRPRMALLPHAENAFFIDKSLTHFEFGRDAQGKVNQMTIHQDGMAQVYARVGDLPPERKAVVLPAALLETYLGSYQMAPGFVLEVRRDGEQLVGQATGQPPLNLMALGEGEFFVKQIESASVRFEKGADGKVERIMWKQGGRERPAQRIK